MSPTQKSSLRKQLIGGLVGAVVSLGMYGIYAVVDAPLHSLLASAFAAGTPQERQYTDADRAEHQQMIVERAKDLLRR
jgi:hypothetical protein